MTWLKEIQDDSGILLFNAHDYPYQSIGIYKGNGKTAVILGLDGVTVWITVDELARFAARGRAPAMACHHGQQ